MPVTRTYSKRSGQRVGPTQNRRSRKRDAEIPKQTDEPDNLTESDPLNPTDSKTGLNWDWVKTLNQDPKGKGYFPTPFIPPVRKSFTGDEDDQPKITDDADLTEYTAWVLARVEKLTISKVVGSMIKDPNLKPKWTLSLNNHHFYRVRRRRELKLVQFQSPQTNYEAAYAAIVGIVLPPEHACQNCKANQGPFQNCIVVPGYLHGACAGCHYNSGGSRCSHRPDGTRRFRIAGVSTYVPFSSLTRTTTIDRYQPTTGIDSKAIGDIKAKLRGIIDEIEVLEHQNMTVVP